MTYDDDLGELADSPLVRALRAPGTPSELGGEEQVLAAFREQHGGGRRRRRGPGRVVGRIGTGGTALITAIALTGGGVAAAAYNQALPDRVQAFAHDALGGLGVPPARTREPARPPSDPAAESPRAGSTVTPGGPRADSPTAAPSSGRPEDRPRRRGHASVREHETPTGPAVVRVSLSARTVDPGDSTVISARVRDAALMPVPDQEVALWQRPAGGEWRQVGSGVTDADGWVSITTDPVTASTDLRLEATVVDGLGEAVLLQSESRQVAVRPAITTSTSGSLLTVQVGGARAGDPVYLARRAPGGRMLRVGTMRLDEQGVATYDLARFRGQVRIRIRLPRTGAHLAGERWVVVRLGSGPAEPQPEPSPEPTPGAEPTPG
ncbi:hypothetical protein [Pimelobacter simplex]|uniref:hypothetical protein n=1 Tax=Nocardioides simplex TaxID=2045 RepID=UPI003AAB4EFA